MTKSEKRSDFLAVSFNLAAFSDSGGGAVFRLSDIDSRSTRLIMMRETLTHLIKQGSALLEENFSGWEEAKRKAEEKRAYEKAVALFHELEPKMSLDDLAQFRKSEVKNAINFNSIGDYCELSTCALDGSYQNILMLPTTLRPIIEKSERVLGMLRPMSN